MGDDNTKSEGEVAGATAAEDKKNGSKEGETTNDNDAKPENLTTDASSGDAAAAGDTPSPEEKDEKTGDSAKDESKQDSTTTTEATTSEGTTSKSDGDNNKAADAATTNANAPVVSSSKKSRPPYKYDPDKITLRFLFANRDGLTVTVECRPGDTIGEVKGALLSVWPTDLPGCSGGDRLRLVCMGKGILMPDTRTLEDCQIPVFKTHPTPVNVSVRPEMHQIESAKSGNDGNNRRANTSGGSSGGEGEQTSQGCACVIL